MDGFGSISVTVGSSTKFPSSSIPSSETSEMVSVLPIGLA